MDIVVEETEFGSLVRTNVESVVAAFRRHPQFVEMTGLRQAEEGWVEFFFLPKDRMPKKNERGHLVVHDGQ